MYAPMTLWVIATFALVWNHKRTTQAKEQSFPKKTPTDRLPRYQGWAISFLMSCTLWVGIIYGVYRVCR